MANWRTLHCKWYHGPQCCGKFNFMLLCQYIDGANVNLWMLVSKLIR